MKKFLLFVFALSTFQLANSQTVVDIIVGSPDHNTLETAVIAAELDDDLSGTGPFTVFAPTDEAFAALGTLVNDLLQDPTGDLADILLYHVLGSEVPASGVFNGLITDALNPANTLKFTVTSGGSVFVNQAMVTVTDLQGTNGIVHVIDAVVLPSETVVDVAIDNGFNTLTTAVVAAELLPALSDPFATYTVFAPTDDAFAALGSVVTDLLQDPTGALQDILLYHVLDAQVASGDVTNGLIASPLSPSNTLKLTKTGGGDVFVNQAQVDLPDVGADNGVVHVIDQVVLPSETVVDIAIDNDFTTLTTAVVAAELLPALTDPSATFTVFAPTDDAFAALGTVVDDLLLDPTGDLRDILLYHVLGAHVASGDVTNGLITNPLNDENSLKFTVTTTNDVFVNQAEVTAVDINSDNGVVHVIDAVVLPSETVVDIAIDNGFSTLTTAVVAAELLPALTDPFATFTVFAPTDDAFSALGGTLNDLLMDPTGQLKDILMYHVLGSEVFSTDVTNGLIADPLNDDNSLKFTATTTGNVFVNQAQVTGVDIEADNGVVHIIDQVVLPIETVVDVAIDNGFGTLTTAVVAAELLPALTDPAGTYTVFAPTDAAFAAIPSDVLNDLLSDPTGDLTGILLYHVVGSEAFSTDLSDGQSIMTLEGSDVVVTIGTMVMINDATVTLADVDADNGVVHVIDQVLLPATGINENDFEVSVYPNPTTDFIMVNTQQNIDRVEIYDTAGKLVQTDDNFTNRVNLSFLNNGIYSVRFVDGNQFSSLQIIKK